MNTILERAIAELAKLSDAEQEAYALQLLEVMEDEKGWDERWLYPSRSAHDRT
ncbi:MAG: hypothetical protein IT565_09530 [Rhodospirillales bacterium]|nr:hypothetical protein [Rhodospirillales bacterium]